MLVAHEICESLVGYDSRSRQMFATHGRRYLLTADVGNSLDMLVALGDCSRADDLARAMYGAMAPSVRKNLSGSVECLNKRGESPQQEVHSDHIIT